MALSPVLEFDDCPPELRALIEECFERLKETVEEADARWRTVKAQVENGETPTALPLAQLLKIERYQARIEALEVYYYDQKFGSGKAREPLR